MCPLRSEQKMVSDPLELEIQRGESPTNTSLWMLGTEARSSATEVSIIIIIIIIQ